MTFVHPQVHPQVHLDTEPGTQAEIPLETWVLATWETFVALADQPAYAQRKGYYYQGHMRFEPMSTGSDHSRDHMTIVLSVGLFATLRGLPINGHDACSYRKVGMAEFQPDASYYVGETADAIPWGTRVIDLDQYPQPTLVIEVADTSLADDLGAKRFLYEELAIREYWIVDVQGNRILAFSMSEDGSIRHIRESQVLPGLRLEILEQALERSRQENQTVTTAWLMAQWQGAG